jgi:peptidoglycan/xylan/chitin deacetylase (PgdA/CDA1 family)
MLGLSIVNQPQYKQYFPHGIMFHHFFDDVHPRGQGAISNTDLERIINFIGRDRILDADEWLDKATKGILQETDLCFTFDDNLKCQYDVALPVLKTFNIKPFWFVYTSPLAGILENLEIYRYFRTKAFENFDGFYASFLKSVSESEFADVVTQGLSDFNPNEYLKEFSFYSLEDKKYRFIRDVLNTERYNKIMDSMIASFGIHKESLSHVLWMTAAEIKNLSNSGHIVGLHSHSHPTQMAKLSTEEQEFEYVTNSRYLSQMLGVSPISMSHPRNSYDTRTIQILQRQGIKLGFRSNLYPSPNDFGLEFPREDHTNIMKLLSQ